jgi:hypothetical protein
MIQLIKKNKEKNERNLIQILNNSLLVYVQCCMGAI